VERGGYAAIFADSGDPVVFDNTGLDLAGLEDPQDFPWQTSREGNGHTTLAVAAVSVESAKKAIFCARIGSFSRLYEVTTVLVCRRRSRLALRFAVLRLHRRNEFYAREL
jgi:hypothetical protein